MVLGTELQALTRGHRRPVIWTAVGRSPRSEGSRDHVGEVRGCARPDQLRSLHQEKELPSTWPLTGCTNVLEPCSCVEPAFPLVLQMEAISNCPHVICPHVHRAISPVDSLLLRCFHLSWDILFIALTLYFELPVQVERPAKERNFSWFSIL